jgi:hypothetical protein
VDYPLVDGDNDDYETEGVSHVGSRPVRSGIPHSLALGRRALWFTRLRG